MNKIQAIKAYRGLTGCVLREARAAVEAGWRPGDAVEEVGLLITAPVEWFSVEVSEETFNYIRREPIEFCPVQCAEQCFRDSGNGYAVKVAGRHFHVTPQMHAVKVKHLHSLE